MFIKNMESKHAINEKYGKMDSPDNIAKLKSYSYLMIIATFVKCLKFV